MRLIDADDFENRMYREVFEKDTDMRKWDSGCWMRYKLFENVLKEQPTIEPERTGKWIDCNNSEHWKCSECGYRGPYSWDDQHGFEEWLSDYCPNCGARMES